MAIHRALVVAALILASACGKLTPKERAIADMPDIDGNAALNDIKKLASDEFEGRAPGSKGEQLAVQYISDQFKAAGLQPGNPDGTWVQKVPLVSLTPVAKGPLVVKKGGKTASIKVHDEFVAFSRRVTDNVSIENSPLVFVGYGVQAPEFNWDDFKGVDVKGKTIVVLVNDPQVPLASDPKTLDPALFGGNRMTYYGRWTYKYDKASELGADACIIVHETPFAGYGFNVVQTMGGERFNLVTPDRNMGLTKVQGWLTLDATKALFAMAGQDFDELKAKAQTRDFKPVELGATASFAMTQQMRNVDSQNVVGRLPGSDPSLADEHVVFSAHWDHFGIGEPDKTGDRIFNGAADNASGTAGIIAIARAMKKMEPGPKRSILFLAVTAEEQGLLGSEYYAKFPLYPLAKTLADINVDDNLPMWGPTKDVVVIGLGASDLDDYLRDAAAEMGRVLVPDAEPEKGLYYRSDHFNFAKVGVPALDTDDGLDYVGKAPDFGKKKKDEYTDHIYHTPADQVDPAWNMTGYSEQAKLLMAVGFRVANAAKFPEWKPGNEFKSVRDASLGGK